MSIVYEEKRTNAPMSQVVWGYQTPVASSDVNEAQYILNKNIVDYFIGPIEADNFKLTINDITKTLVGSTNVLGFRYMICDSDGNLYFGCANSVFTLDIANVEPNATYDIYAFVRPIVLDKDSLVYKDGLRTNDLQPSIIETEVENNIGDLHIEDVETGRLSIEFTFVIAHENDPEPELTSWNYVKSIAKIKLDGDGVPTSFENEDGDTTIATEEYVNNKITDKLESEIVVTIPADDPTDSPYTEETDSDSNTYYTIEIPVTGMTSSYKGIRDAKPVYSRPYNVESKASVDNLFDLIQDGDSLEDKIKLYFNEKPNTQFQIYLYGV